MISPADGALGVYGAVGDACAGRRHGFARRRARLAARFARFRGAGDDVVAASWYAGLLAETGLVLVDVPEGASAGLQALALADFPLHGAHLAAAIPGLPARAADIVRWHREHEDGTGFPDALRWDGVPADASAVGIVHAFLSVLESDEGAGAPAEAAFALSAESGRRFSVRLVTAFREFVTRDPDVAAEDDGESPGIAEAAADDAALIALLAERVSARRGASDRATRLGPLAVILEAATRRDRDAHAEDAAANVAAVAERVAASVPHYAADARSVAAAYAARAGAPT
ncbi:MAG TPA: hypothetical protein VFB22_04410 [Candidatus Baltobacteraceae bacterium]|nr:hypothetical protein [Candidatus Baltobacteraceae bacterium]